MPKGVSNNPEADRRRQPKTGKARGGKPSTLPPGAEVWRVRVTRDERAAIKALLAQMRDC